MAEEERFWGTSWAQGRQSPSQTVGRPGTLLEETYHIYLKELAWWHELQMERRKRGSEGGGKKEGKGRKEGRKYLSIFICQIVVDKFSF